MNEDPTAQLLRDQYVEVLETIRGEHAVHDRLERAASEASRKSMASYDKLNEHRARARSLRAAFAALTGEELDSEMAKTEDRNHERGIYLLEKKEARILTKGSPSERPDYISKGSVVQTRSAMVAE